MNQQRRVNHNWYQILFGLTMAIVPSNADAQSPMVSVQGEAQGTTYHVKYRDPQQRNLKEKIDSLLLEIDKCLSLYRPDSELSQFNRTSSHRFQRPYFYPVLKKSEAIFRATKGAFDPTVLPLVEAYGFGPKKPAQTDVINVDSLLQWVGFGQIVFDSLSVRKQKPNVRLDFNGIAQGYSVDLVTGLLEDHGIEHYMVEIGGEIRAKGQKDKAQPWVVGIDNPIHPNQLQLKVKLMDRAMTTAGNYRNQYQADGQLFSHIINPKTGEMEQSSVLSVTVFAADAITADGYDTAFMVMGLENTKRFLEQHKELDAYIIYADNGQLKTFATAGLTDL
ncbi:FAD:protein FMN transferase [Spirosoma aerolatum]|uniref:FAD:protein FMN transferase n=1 Tax=Spirosoma aerolatum TaxID=1211326 RepID=UPI0009AD1E27|nr:FAD:protein FMN transferase [Spirosoma aerolatum]